MKTRRFVTREALRGGEFFIKDESLLRQIKNVLKLKIGERIILTDGRGRAVAGELRDVKEGEVKVFLGEVGEVKSFGARVVLSAAVLKKDNFEWRAQKTTETGVHSIVPAIAERTVNLNLKIDRLRKIAEEAAEQSGRVDVPETFPPTSLSEAIKLSQANDDNFVFDMSGKDFFHAERKKREKVGLFVGPEGGWSDREKELFNKLEGKRSFEIVSLGSMTLRATAAVVAVYLVNILETQ